MSDPGKNLGLLDQAVHCTISDDVKEIILGPNLEMRYICKPLHPWQKFQKGKASDNSPLLAIKTSYHSLRNVLDKRLYNRNVAWNVSGY